MQIEIITRNELELIENKLNQVVELLSKGNILNSDKVYSTLELAKKLKVSTKTIQNWRDQKLIEFSQVHNKIFITEKSVCDFLQNHSIKRKNK